MLNFNFLPLRYFKINDNKVFFFFFLLIRCKLTSEYDRMRLTRFDVHSFSEFPA